MAIEEYKDVRIEGDCGEFTLRYTPLCEHGRPQRLSLEADNEADARCEAAGVLECEESELPEIEWA